MEKIGQEFKGFRGIELRVRANCLQKEGKFEEALECLKAFLKIESDSPDIYSAIGIVLCNLKKYEDALCYLKQAIVLFDKSEFCKMKVEQDNSLITVLQRELSKVSKQAKKNTLNHEAYALYNLKRYDEAIECYNEILKTPPNSTEILHMKGVVLYDLKRYAEAIACFNQAIEISPHKKNSLNYRTCAFYNLKRYKDAIDHYSKLIKINKSKNFIDFLLRGKCYEEIDKKNLALKDFEEAQKLVGEKNGLDEYESHSLQEIVEN